MHRIYPAKLLLFGEYTVLAGSQALAVPLDKWRGEWRKGDVPDRASDALSSPYLQWLEEKEIITRDVAMRIQQDRNDGWFFDSNIPTGCGLGSSGAFVAALYDRYMKKDSREIQQLLAAMEGYFHGTSSGMDPMVSYSRKGIYRDEAGAFHEIDDPGWPPGWKVYVVDSGQPRTTGPLVQLFGEKMKDPEFVRRISHDLVPYVEHAIHFYLSGEPAMLENCMGVISLSQRELFDEFIPHRIKELWDEHTREQGVYLKFCGAGGGGYFLVIDTLPGSRIMPTQYYQVAG